MPEGPDIARIGALIGDPTRINILSALMGGQALTAGELGWKDTVRVDPLTVTCIIVKFEGFVGRYVWHCHMLEHEDNEMMRPYVVTPA